MSSLSRSLFEENAHIAEACLRHPFIRELGDGTLGRDIFKGYLSQDAFYLGGYARAFAFGVIKSRSGETMRTFSSLLNGVLEELTLHGAYSDKWGFPLDCAPGKATSNYVDFLLRVASMEEVGDIAAATLPCDALYLFLGTELKGRERSSSPYSEWIDTYSSKEFRTLTETLEGLVDSHCHDHARARAHYKRALELEYDFFDEAYRSGSL